MIYIPLKLDKNSDRHRASQGHIQIYIPLKLDKNFSFLLVVYLTVADLHSS